MTLKRGIILFPAAFMMNVNLLMINFTVIFFLKDMVGLNASAIGWFFAAGYGCYAIGCIALRPVQNKILPPVSMFIAIAMMLFSIIMISRSTNPVVVLFYYLIFSTAPAFFWPQLMGWLTFKLGTKDLNSTISRFNISWSTGSLCGPLLGGFLAEYNLMLSFYVDMVFLGLFALILLLSLVFLEDMRNFPRHGEEASGEDLHEKETEDGLELINGGKGTILRYGAWIGLFSVYVVLGLLNNIFPLFIRQSMGFGESVAGNILFARGAASALGFFLAGRFTAWHFNSRVMFFTQAASALIMIILVFVKTIPGFYLLFVIFGLLSSMAYTSGIFHGSAGAIDRGRRMALFEAILTLGVVTGSIGGGYFFQYFSIYWAFLSVVLIITAGLIAQILIIKFLN